MGTVEGRGNKLSNSPFSLVRISKVSSCKRSKAAASCCSLIGLLKWKPSEVVKKMSKSCENLIKTFHSGNGEARSTVNQKQTYIKITKNIVLLRSELVGM